MKTFYFAVSYYHADDTVAYSTVVPVKASCIEHAEDEIERSVSKSTTDNGYADAEYHLVNQEGEFQ